MKRLSKEENIQEIKDKLKSVNIPEVKKALKLKLKMLQGNNTVLK